MGGIWEIKHPSIQGENPNTKKVAIYTEVVGYENVKNWLIEHGYLKNDMLQLRTEGSEGTDVSSDFIPDDGPGQEVLIPIANYSTRRSKYKHQGVTIDIDFASYGYNILELEILAENLTSIEDSQKRLHSLAVDLGLEQQEDNDETIRLTTKVKPINRGKLEEYFYRYNFSHFEALCKLGIFLE